MKDHGGRGSRKRRRARRREERDTASSVATTSEDSAVSASEDSATSVDSAISQVDRYNILSEEKTIIHFERKKITKGQDEQTDSEMIEALLTSTRAIRNTAMEFAVKPICSSQDVDLHINRIGEHIKNLNDMSKENIFGCIPIKERKISSEIKKIIRTFDDFLAAGKASSKDIQYFASEIERNFVSVQETLSIYNKYIKFMEYNEQQKLQQQQQQKQHK